MSPREAHSEGSTLDHAAGLLRRVQSRLVLPSQEPPGPIEYRPVLVGYVALVVVGAVGASVLSWTPPRDLAALAVGGLATVIIAAYAVRAVSGVNVAWSSTVFMHLAMALGLGSCGAVVAALAHGLVGGLLVRSGWFRSVFNTAAFLLMSLSSRAAALAVAGHVDTGNHALIAGFIAGVTSWVVNYALLAIVIRIASSGQVSIRRGILGNLGVLPYHVAYGPAAASLVLLYQQIGFEGFLLPLTPVLIGQAHLVLLARRTEEHRLQLARAEEAERRRIARDLHDSVVQSVAGSAMVLAGASQEMNTSIGAQGARWSEIMDTTASDLRDAARDLRTLIIEIAPPTLYDEGLRVALTRLAESCGVVQVTVEVDETVRLPDEHEALAYRVAQEAVRNIKNHAQATNVRMNVEAHDGMVRMTIEDDGRGFTPEDVAARRQEGHVGTRGIEELALEHGGSLTISSVPGRGTRLLLELPARSSA